MKKTAIISLLSLLCLAAAAQPKAGTWSVTPRIGVALSSLAGSDIFYVTPDGDKTLSARRRALFTGGVELRYQLADRVALSGALMYSGQGCNYSNHEDYSAGADPDGMLHSTGYNDITYTLHYINVPLIASIYLLKGLAFNFGLQPGFLCDARLKYTAMDMVTDPKTHATTTGPMTTTEQNLKDTRHVFDFAIPLGVSYEWQNVVLDVRYNLGLTHAFANDKARNSVIAVTAGYKLDL